MSYGRLIDKEEQVEAEIAQMEAKAAALLADAEATDTAEDERLGVDGKDADLPAELGRREKRLARLQAARAQIEAEAADKARAHAEDLERRRQERVSLSDEQAAADAGQKAAAKARPKPKAQANFIPKNATLKQRMARKLRTKPGRAAYSRRKAIVEPVFGQIMTCQNGRQLLLRGEGGARGEWRLPAACHNFRKAFRHVRTAGLATTTA